MRPVTRLLGSAGLVGLLVLGITGCSGTVPLDPATDAANPSCAKVIVQLPSTVAGLPIRETDAQGTGAWGNPSGVILHCGVPVPAPTATLPCLTVDGIDWLRDDKNDPDFIFTTYGRDPAVEVVLNDTQVSALSALTDLAFAVGSVPAVGKCISPEDTTQ